MSQDYYRDCVVSRDGSKVLTVTRTVETGMHVRISRFGSLVWRDFQDTGYVDGIALGRVMGNFPLCFDEVGLVLRQYGTGGYLAEHDPADGRDIGTVAAPYASEGIERVDEATGEIIMGNDPRLRRVMPNGELWHHVCETENFIVGQYGRDPDFGGSLSKLDKRTGVVTRWLGYTPHPPRIAELYGVLTVAISGRDTPEPQDVVWSENFPPLPLPEPRVIDLDLPEPPTKLPAIWIGTTGPSKGPGSCSWSNNFDPFDNRPATEMAEWGDSIAHRPLLHALWLSDGNRDPVTVDAEIAYAKARGAKAVYLHEDHADHRASVIAAAHRVRNAGLTPILGAHAVQSWIAFTDAFRYLEAGIEVDSLDHLMGITLNVRTANKDLNQFSACIDAVLARMQQGRVSVVYLWGWHELTDWPKLKAYLTKVAEACQTPKLFPGQVAAPAPVPAEPPNVSPGKPRKGNSTGPKSQVTGWAALFASIAALFRRK